MDRYSSYAIALYNKKAYAVNSALEKRAKFSGYMVIISTNSEQCIVTV